jgi:NADPH-dependent ferric siderophore reductase
MAANSIIAQTQNTRFQPLIVLANQSLSPSMRRLTLRGDVLANWPDNSDGGYFKLCFEHDGQPLQRQPDEGQRPLMRTYTIRHLDTAQQQLQVDVMLHGDQDHSGPASRWAAKAQPGSQIMIAGPGPAKSPALAQYYLLVGDMTALPAISAHLENLPTDARGDAVIAVPNSGDQLALQRPSGVNIHWLTGPQPDLLAKVKTLTLPADLAVWVACEFDQMRAMRQFVRQQLQLPKQQTYLSSYWKAGRSEDEHKVLKQKDQAHEG